MYVAWGQKHTYPNWLPGGTLFDRVAINPMWLLRFDLNNQYRKGWRDSSVHKVLAVQA